MPLGSRTHSLTLLVATRSGGYREPVALDQSIRPRPHESLLQTGIGGPQLIIVQSAGLLTRCSSQLLICPLYAKLAPQEQAKAFAPTPPNTRKIILSTNVAETSVTIPGVSYVVDTGLAKEKEYHPSVGTLAGLEPFSRAEADLPLIRQVSSRSSRKTSVNPRRCSEPVAPVARCVVRRPTRSQL